MAVHADHQESYPEAQQDTPTTHSTFNRGNSFLTPLYRPVSILFILLLITMILLDRPLVRGDGLAYLVWIDTLAGDFDINLNNQHDRFREINTYHIQWDYETERWVNIFPFGIAYLQAPFYWIGKGFAEIDLLNANSEYFLSLQGVPQAISIWLMMGANVMALGACLAAYIIGRRLCERWLAAVIAFTVFVGTPLVYYSTITPVNSHNPGAFTLGIFVFLLVQCTGAFSTNEIGKKHPLWWILLGLFAGLSVLVRWQLAVAVAPAWGLLIYQKQWRGIVIATIAAGLTVLPLPFIWNAMFGVPFLVPFDAVTDDQFMQSQGNQAIQVLGMLVSHSPIVLFSLIGLGFMWKINRVWALMLGAMILLQLIVNGAALDWNSGETYGMRRMSELYVVYVLLACAAAHGLVTWFAGKQKRLQRIGTAAVYGSFLVLIGYSFLYIFAFMVYSWHNPQWIFDNTPGAILDYFIHLPYRWQILWEVYKTHAGLLSWGMPGP